MYRREARYPDWLPGKLIERVCVSCGKYPTFCQCKTLSPFVRRALARELPAKEYGR